MPSLVIDIETVAHEFESLDEHTRADILARIRGVPGTPEYDQDRARLLEEFQFSPLVGEIVVLGVYDVERASGVVYFQAPEQELGEIQEGDITYKQRSEKSMLESFWGGISGYDECITFNGRGFDIPYIIARSGVNRVHVTRDLMSNRYNNRSWGGTVHLDLLDQLGYYGAVRRTGGLQLWTQALGIESPKGGDISGKDVGKAFQDGRALDIARYNAKDLIATAELYRRWKEYMQPH
jgi:DNA polymerase elongation subunit (family B)